jgi:hypothetical protein
MFTNIHKRILAWISQKDRAYLLLAILFFMGSFTLTAHALLTVSNSGLMGSSAATVDASGTLSLGTASSTSVLIGSTTSPVTIIGTLGVNGTVTVGNTVLSPTFTAAPATGSAAQNFTLQQRWPGNFGFPVATLRPTTANTGIAADLMPNGSAVDGGYGFAWQDICDTDSIASNPAMNCLHLSAATAAMLLSSIEYNGATQKPLGIGIGTTPAMFIRPGLGISFGSSPDPALACVSPSTCAEGNINVQNPNGNTILNLYRTSSSQFNYYGLFPEGALSSSHPEWIAGLISSQYDYRLATYNGSALTTVVDLLPSGGVWFGSSPSDPGANNVGVQGTITTGGFLAGGSPSAISGCGTPTPTGGKVAGTFVAGATSCTPVLTLPTAPNGWNCSIVDRSTGTGVVLMNTSSTTNNATFPTFTAVSGDVIAYSCIGY